MAKKVRDNTINIKQSVIKGHIGASKLVNDDWKTVAYSFPREHIKTKFEDKELRYNGIYFLFGYDDGKEVVYVGQALKRSNGESILARLRDHNDSYTESYCDKWNWVIAITNDGDTWGPTELNALESIMISETPYKNSLNGRKQNSGGADLNAYMDKVTQIKAFITAVGFNVYNDVTETENINIIDKTYESNLVEDLQNGMSRIPEIVTPQKVVKSMVDMLPADVWNPNTKFLDMACKGGEYLREVYDRLMETELLQSAFPNIIERSNHILKNQIYGIALSDISRERTAKKLLGEDRNIHIIHGYINKMKGLGLGTKPDGTHKSIKDMFNDLFGGNMKFDVVIGNPPYQDSNGSGNGGGGTALYDKFVLNSFQLSTRLISLITPARWYTDESKVKELKEKLLSCNNITELHDFPNTDDVFSGVYIMGGVCYYLIDKEYTGDCRVYEHRDNRVIESLRPLKESFADIFVRNSDAVSILSKVLKYNGGFISMYDYINDYNIFKLRSYERGIENKNTEDDIKLYFTGNSNKGGGVGYISRDLIPAGEHLIDAHKVYINSVSDNMLSFPYKTLYKGFYGEPSSVCTESYLVIGPLKNKEDADNIIKYLQTKFVRILVQQRKTSQLAYKKVYRFVPIQNFTNQSDIDWSQSISDIDKQLYQKYNLSSEEISYIEQTIKSLDDEPKKLKFTREDAAAAYINQQLTNQP